ncbi:MAG: hypothetical protein ACFB51_21395 [Anaerolineae bacterium]
MPTLEFWDVMLNPVFLVMFGLVLLPFAALAYSVWVTWEENKDQVNKR